MVGAFHLDTHVTNRKRTSHRPRLQEPRGGSSPRPGSTSIRGGRPVPGRRPVMGMPTCSPHFTTVFYLFFGIIGTFLASQRSSARTSDSSPYGHMWAHRGHPRCRGTRPARGGQGCTRTTAARCVRIMRQCRCGGGTSSRPDAGRRPCRHGCTMPCRVGRTQEFRASAAAGRGPATEPKKPLPLRHSLHSNRWSMGATGPAAFCRCGSGAPVWPCFPRYTQLPCASCHLLRLLGRLNTGCVPCGQPGRRGRHPLACHAVCHCL